MGEIGIQEELTLAGFDHTGGPEDGGKQITLGIGSKMLHDENVGAFLAKCILTRLDQSCNHD